MKSEFFQEIIKRKFERKGTQLFLSFFYYDLFSIAAVYTASTKKVQALLPKSDLHPVELLPG